MKPEALPAPTFDLLDEDASMHQLRIHRCLLAGRQVMFEGRLCYVDVMHARRAGGGTPAEVWVGGRPDPVDPSELTIPPIPK